ncbi:hypothetical protein [Pseudomonas sp. dw_358]|uniref:hypothetical protein n=1 Tax=Pseudomonas sp. dw_358 TaxID=2720083 RepID=UPI001BD440E0|nr:hypothetical protein [Pseudomonas sp. dw_358]
MRSGWIALFALMWAGTVLAAGDYTAFEPQAGGGTLHYYVTPGVKAPRAALIVLHGHPRDAENTFDAATEAVANAGESADTVVVAPQFQVSARSADKCTGQGVPDAEPGDLLWTCRSWVEGEPARNGAGVNSYAALDALVHRLHEQWPSLHEVTVAGFSAGGQMVQHYIGYAAIEPGVKLRYVVGSPGSYLYFDPQRPDPVASCADANQWRYGTDNAPAWLTRSPADARAHYAGADVHYLVGALDSSTAKGTFYPILDKSCGAMSQGEFRLQRAQGFVEYARKRLVNGHQSELVVVPDCAHDVRCVFPAPAARQALLGR